MRNQYGLSLVELMISVALGLILMTGVIQMFVSSLNVSTTQQGLSRIQETGRFAMEFIGHDLRMANNYGCSSVIDPSTGKTRVIDPLTGPPGNKAGLTGLHFDFLLGLRGYNTSSVLPADALPNSVAVDLGSGFTVKSNSDVLVIRGANERGLLVQDSSPATDTNILGYTKDGSLANSCIEGFCNGTVAVVNDCQSGRVFKISSVPTLAGNLVSLNHTGDDWQVNTYSLYKYAKGSILPVHTIVYFVATSTTPTGNTTPSLWQKVDNQTAVELLQGVEDMSITYSVIPSTATPAPAYKKAVNVVSWANIASVQVELLARGDSPKNLEKSQPYTFNGTTTTPAATDQYMRQVFKSTFSIRSKVH